MAAPDLHSFYLFRGQSKHTMAEVQDVKVQLNRSRDLLPCSDIATEEKKFVDMMSAVEEGRMGYSKFGAVERSEGTVAIRVPEVRAIL